MKKLFIVLLFIFVSLFIFSEDKYVEGCCPQNIQGEYTIHYILDIAKDKWEKFSEPEMFIKIFNDKYELNQKYFNEGKNRFIIESTQYNIEKKLYLIQSGKVGIFIEFDDDNIRCSIIILKFDDLNNPVKLGEMLCTFERFKQL